MNVAVQPARWLPAAVLALGFAMLAPVLWSGWTADDAFYSALNGILGSDRSTLWQAMAHSFDLWFFGNGRFYPGLILEKYLVFAIFTNLVAYKVLLIALTLTAVEMFRRCVQAYTTRSFGIVAALFVVTLFFVHGYQDALVAYNGMPQVVAIAMLGSLMAFRAALAEEGRRMAILSAVLYAIAACTYEDVYALCVLYPMLAWYVGRNRQAAMRSAWPQLAIAAALTVFELVLHVRARLPADALYAVHLDGAGFLRTALYEVTASLPLAYWLADPPRFLRLDIIPSALVFAGFATVAWIALGGADRAGNRRLPFLTGSLLIVLPALPIALLVKYQQELRLGLGYLPVFFQTFGVALLLAAFAAAAARSRFGRAARIVIVAAVGALATVTYAANVQLVRAGEPARLARFSLQKAFARGLIGSLTDGTVVAIPRTFDWIDYDDSGPDGISARGIAYMFGRRRVDFEPPGDPRASFALSYRSGSWTIHKLGRAPQANLPRPCNNSSLVNGDFTFGFRCWAHVVVAPAGDATPHFRIEVAGACFPAAQAGNPYAVLDLPAAGQAYIAQTFRYRGKGTTVTLRAWRSMNPVTVRVGTVYPVGTGIGTERIVGTFDPPALQSRSGACSGLRPVVKSYRISGYAPGAQIQLRLHAATGTAGAAANFDDVTSTP